MTLFRSWILGVSRSRKAMLRETSLILCRYKRTGAVALHTINAEDALTHKVTSFPVMVSGKSIALRPSHLQLSINSLNLGSGDGATSSKQTISLTNLGSGQISWQGSSTKSWLMMTPASGTFYQWDARQSHYCGRSCSYAARDRIKRT